LLDVSSRANSYLGVKICTWTPTSPKRFIFVFPNDPSQPGRDCSEFMAVKVASSPIHQLGLFTEEDIGEDEMITELIGRRVAAEDVDALEKHYQGIGNKECISYSRSINTMSLTALTSPTLPSLQIIAASQIWRQG
jgi:hypothetical protein